MGGAPGARVGNTARYGMTRLGAAFDATIGLVSPNGTVAFRPRNVPFVSSAAASKTVSLTK